MLIGLTGPKQAGKDTVYERAAHIMADVLPVRRASFADPLYESAAAALGVSVEQLRRWKNDVGVYVTVTEYDPVYGEYVEQRFQTVRLFLQRYGTEAHRDVFGQDFWVDNVNLAHGGRLVLVTDVRFPNEADAVLRAGGSVVRVVGPDEVENAGDGHASEAGIPDEFVADTIDNTVRDDGFRSLDAEINRVIRGLLARGRA